MDNKPEDNTEGVIVGINSTGMYDNHVTTDLSRLLDRIAVLEQAVNTIPALETRLENCERAILSTLAILENYDRYDERRETLNNLLQAFLAAQPQLGSKVEAQTTMRTEIPPTT